MGGGASALLQPSKAQMARANRMKRKNEVHDEQAE
jgi:hypothetical protein